MFADNVAHNYAAKFEQMIIRQHVHLRRKSQSHALAHVLMRLYPIDKSLVLYKAKEGHHVRISPLPCRNIHKANIQCLVFTAQTLQHRSRLIYSYILLPLNSSHMHVFMCSRSN